jgi:hypothetical protein
MNQVMLEARAKRGFFGLLCKWLFWLFQIVMLLVLLGTCAAVLPSMPVKDPDAAAVILLVTGAAIAGIWVVWPLGTLLLGLLVLATRGRKYLIPAPLLARPGSVPAVGGGRAPPGR